ARALRRELALHEDEMIHPHPRDLGKLSHLREALHGGLFGLPRFRPRQGQMRNEWADFPREADLRQFLVEAFREVDESPLPCARSDPDDARAFRVREGT